MNDVRLSEQRISVKMKPLSLRKQRVYAEEPGRDQDVGAAAVAQKAIVTLWGIIIRAPINISPHLMM